MSAPKTGDAAGTDTGTDITTPGPLQNVYPSVLPPRASAPPSSSSSTPHLNPSVVVVVVILSVVFVLSGFLHLLARCLHHRRNGRARAVVPARRRHQQQHHSPLVSALHGQLQHLFHLHDAGVEQAFIDTLPVFSYGSIRGLKDSADCAVCLTEFGDDDRLRLLPKCKHAFHLECIDTWLLSNSTCPLCRRSLLPDPGASTSALVDPTNNMMHSSRFICGPRLSVEEQLSLSLSVSQQQQRGSSRRRSLHGSIHGSYQNSFRICDVEESTEIEDTDTENEIQEIRDDTDTESVGAMGRMDEMEILEMERLGMGMGRPIETPSPFVPTIRVMDANGEQRVLKVILGRVAGKVKRTSAESRKLTRKGGRSYSMGSYEYIVDPSSWELRIAPTPYPGRPQDWASSKPTHRSALSDSIPELASAGGTPANDDLFWASRGLYTPHTLSRVRELLTPIGSEYSNNAMFSPAANAFLGYYSHSSPSPSPRGNNRWIDIDIEHGEIVEEADPACSLDENRASSSRYASARTQSLNASQKFEARSSWSTPEASPSPSSRTPPAAEAVAVAVAVAEVVPEALAGKITTSDPKQQRSSSLSRLPEGKASVSWYRRSLSETSAGMEHVVKELQGAACGDELLRSKPNVWELAAAPAAANNPPLPSAPAAAPGSTSEHAAARLASTWRSSLNWLMGRDKRMVFSATSPDTESSSADPRTRPISI